MRGFRGALVVVGLIAAALGGVACSTESDPERAKTPEGATTVVNSAVQTDKDGKTIATEPAASTETDEGDPAVEAGAEVFAASCEGCHGDGGKTAVAGPVLAGVGLAEGRIRTQVEQGGGAMPAFAETLSPEEISNVVAFVGSIQ